MGYSPWGCKGLDTTEQLHFHFSPNAARASQLVQWLRIHLSMQEIQKTFQSLGQEDSLEEDIWQPTPVFLPGKSYGERSLADYRPWDHKRVGHD